MRSMARTTGLPTRLPASANVRKQPHVARVTRHVHCCHGGRYKEAYVLETLAFVDSLVNNKPVPCSGEDGLIALLMAIAAEISAEERRWVQFSGPAMQQVGRCPTSPRPPSAEP